MNKLLTSAAALAAFLLLFWSSFQPSPITEAHNATIWYVNAAATGGSDGSSWVDSFADLQDALAVAATGDEIWVAAGLYKPTADETDREATFHLLNGVALYGGFAGHESAWDERDWESNITVLSGDIENNDLTNSHGVVTDTANIIGANSYHVVVGSGTDETTVLDGFIITAGQANHAYFAFPCTERCGGGIFNDSGSPKLSNISVSGNYATMFGGGLYNTSSSSPMLSNIHFVANSAAHGGGIFNGENSQPTFVSVVIQSNYAQQWGGGMYNDSSSPSLADVTFTSNSANSGGGMYNNNGSMPTLDYVTFTENSANGAGGGMINAANSSASISNVIFERNSASSGGGGMFNASGSNPTLTNVLFSENFSSFFGGGGMYNSSSNPVLNDVTFQNNSSVNGGGMYNGSSNPVLNRVSFSYNSASGGGGMMNEWNSSPVLTNVTFIGNSGGGMLNINGSSPELTNALFSGNVAYAGGAMYNSLDSSPTVINATFSGNSASAYGGGIFNVANSNATIQNSIFWGNQDSSGIGTAASSIYNSSNATPAISYSLIQGSNGSGPDWDSELGTDLGNNLDTDPLFIEPPDPTDAPTLAGNLRLQIGSPSIDAGNNAYVDGVTTDLDGHLRIFGPQVDLGSFEARYGTLVVNVVGQGSVEITPDQPQYLYGDVITLTATAGPGWRFVGWSGNATGEDSPLTLTFDGDATVTATFEQEEYTLTLNIVDNGSVAVDPEQAVYFYGDVVTLTAVAAPGWAFSGWSGDATGEENPLTLTFDGDATVTATFEQEEYTLTLNIVGNGSVTVDPEQAVYFYGDVVTLTAVAGPGWRFAGWSGDATGEDNPATLLINGDTGVTAIFKQVQFDVYLPLVLR
jgi:hypothetical protein